MKLGKKDKSRKSGNRNEAPKKPSPIDITLLPSLLCFIFPLLVSVWIYFSLSSTFDKRHEEIANLHAQIALQEYELLLQKYQSALSGLGEDPHIAGLALNRDYENKRIHANRLSQTLSDALDIKIFSLAEAKINSRVSPPINFAALEMVKEAQKGFFNFPEIHIVDNKKIIRASAPIYHPDPNNSSIVGSLLAAFDFEELTKAYTPPKEAMGLLTIEQKFKGAGPAVELHSSGALTGSEITTGTARGKAPYLYANFALSNSFSDTHFNSILFWVLSLSAAALALLASVGGHHLAKLHVTKDLLSLEKFFKQVTTGRPHRQPNFHISNFNDSAKRLLDLIDALVAAQFTQASAKSGKANAKSGSPARKDEFMGIHNDEEELFGLAENEQPQSNAVSGAQSNSPTTNISPTIFRAYDIRGIVGKTLTHDAVEQIGLAIGSECLAQGQNSIVVARDGRVSGPELSERLIQGILATGCNVINIGMTPTPVLYYAAHELNTRSGVMLTGSHNPADYNGLKIVINGSTLAEEGIQALYKRTQNGDFASGQGSIEEQSVSTSYIDRIVEDVILARPVKIVIDCGNGVAGAIAPDLFSQLGCQVTPLYCEVDGQFPNHHPDPSKPANLEALIAEVQKQGAELGIAFDGDGDRIGIVTAAGKIIYPDRILMLIARDILSRNPGADIIFDVKCTRDLVELISDLGGRPIMWKTGHSLIKSKLKETGAVLAGEMSGHIFFNDRWYGFDDALYSAARLLEIISMEAMTSDELFDEFPEKESTPELNIPVAEANKFKVIETIKKRGNFEGGRITDIDGIRVDYNNSWGLVRASNTTPVLVTRFEGEDKEALNKVMAIFKKNILKADSSLKPPF